MTEEAVPVSAFGTLGAPVAAGGANNRSAASRNPAPYQDLPFADPSSPGGYLDVSNPPASVFESGYIGLEPEGDGCPKKNNATPAFDFTAFLEPSAEPTPATAPVDLSALLNSLADDGQTADAGYLWTGPAETTFSDPTPRAVQGGYEDTLPEFGFGGDAEPAVSAAGTNGSAPATAAPAPSQQQPTVTATHSSTSAPAQQQPVSADGQNSDSSWAVMGLDGLGLDLLGDQGNSANAPPPVTAFGSASSETAFTSPAPQPVAAKSAAKSTQPAVGKTQAQAVAAAPPGEPDNSAAFELNNLLGGLGGSGDGSDNIAASGTNAFADFSFGAETSDAAVFGGSPAVTGESTQPGAFDLSSLLGGLAGPTTQTPAPQATAAAGPAVNPVAAVGPVPPASQASAASGPALKAVPAQAAAVSSPVTAEPAAFELNDLLGGLGGSGATSDDAAGVADFSFGADGAVFGGSPSAADEATQPDAFDLTSLLGGLPAGPVPPPAVPPAPPATTSEPPPSTAGAVGGDAFADPLLGLDAFGDGTGAGVDLAAFGFGEPSATSTQPAQPVPAVDLMAAFGAGMALGDDGGAFGDDTAAAGEAGDLNALLLGLGNPSAL